jgi:hypothetical protein
MRGKMVAVFDIFSVYLDLLYAFFWAIPRRLKYICICIYKGKGKAVPLQAWSAPEGSMKLRFPDFMTIAQDGGKVVNLTNRLPLPPGNTSGTHFC